MTLSEHLQHEGVVLKTVGPLIPSIESEEGLKWRFSINNKMATMSI
jgi:hypothetical protein